jgi:hypothetical protein
MGKDDPYEAISQGGSLHWGPSQEVVRKRRGRGSGATSGASSGGAINIDLSDPNNQWILAALSGI